MLLYRLLLLLYPASFRNEYGEELRRLFARRVRDASPLGALAVWAEALADVVTNAARAHGDLLRQDLRYAYRTLRAAPAFSVTAILVTALGVGANTAVFSVADRVLLRPLPYPEPDRLLKVWEAVPGYGKMELSPANYRDWRAMATSFEELAAYHRKAMNLSGDKEPQRVEAVRVSSGLLPMLGVAPALGRLFSAEDDRDGAPATTVLSHGLWQSEFGGARDVLGKSLRLDGEPYQVIGVLPAGFSFPARDTRLWVTLRLPEAAYQNRGDNYLVGAARLKPGVSLESARSELKTVTEALERQYPKENEKRRANLFLMRDEISDRSRLMLQALLGAALCVLLIACSNLASLLLARALRRRKEMTVRAALGAGRERLLRQLLTESLLLALLGGALGVLLAAFATPLLSRLVPTTLPVADATAIDLRVLGFASLLTLVTGVAFGVLPALRSSSGAQAGGLREGTRAAIGGGGERLRSTLVVAEVTASVVLVIVSGLLIRALFRIQSVDPGFQTERVLTLQTPLPMPRYAASEKRGQLYDQVLADVKALPGVSHAAYISFLPMVMRGGIWAVQIPGLPEDRGNPSSVSLRFVTPGFFAALGIPLRLGRDVEPTDTEAALAVAVVSESFAKRHWPDKDPRGQRFVLASHERQVVGVVGDIRVRGLEIGSEPQVYLPARQMLDTVSMFYAPKDLVVRSSADPMALVPSVRAIIRRADAELPVADVRALGAIVEAETGPRRVQIRVLALFAAMAVLLAGIGIHGLLSYSVSQRIPEIGVRVALGAQPGQVLRMVLKEGVALAGIGCALGLFLGHAAGRGLEALLAGVTPADLATYAVGTGLAVLMTVSGTLVPGLRALRVDVVAALRADN